MGNYYDNDDPFGDLYEQETEKNLTNENPKRFFQTEASKYRFGVSAKGIHLSNDELKLLAELTKCKILNTKQIHKIHESFQSIKEDTLRKKLKRWHDRGIIHKVDLGKRREFGNDLNIYRIDRKGIEFLVNENYLDEKYLNYEISKFGKIKNLDHFLATNQIVIEAQINLQDEFEYANRASYRNSINKKFGIISDAILEFNNVFIYFEIDMGTESLSELNDKLVRYASLAKYDKEHVHVVAISLLDDSYQTRKYYEVRGDKRKANIKKANIYNDVIFENNLHIILSNFKETPNLIFPTIIYSFYRDVPELLTTFQNLFHKKEYLRPVLIDDSNLYSNKVLDFHRPDGFYELYNQTGNMVERIAVLFMNKNDLKLSVIMNNMINSIVNNAFLKFINRLIVVYETKNERESDSFGIQYSDRILFTDLETMRGNNDARYYICSSPFKFKRVEFY